MMLEYLIILLDDVSVPFCHATNHPQTSRLMPLEVLQKAILYGMKENLMIHYVLPQYDLPRKYYEIIETIDNIKLGKDVRIANNVGEIGPCDSVILRIKFETFFNQYESIASSLKNLQRLNICFTDIENFSNDDITKYEGALRYIEEYIFNLYQSGNRPSLNLISDRLYQSKMVNCNAGINNITIAPNGKFYLCPAFYYDEVCGLDNLLNHESPEPYRSVGDLNIGLSIPNRKLLELEHAPICRICDAFQCHRCIWLNQKLTGDINTPSRQQCIVAHIERNAARNLEIKLRQALGREITIPEIDYLDPFDLIIRK